VAAAPAGSGVVLTLPNTYGWTYGLSYSIENVTAALNTHYFFENAPYAIDETSGFIPSGQDATTIVFRTAGLHDGVTRSFKIHLTNYNGTEFDLEADIYGLSIVKEVSYDYDAFNQLVHRAYDSNGPATGGVTDTFFSYESGQVALQFNGASAANLSHRYLWGPAVDQLLAQENVGGALYRTLGDNIGTIRDLATHNSSNQTTTIVNHRNYDEWGNLLSETNSAIDSIFGFTGRQFDDITGLQYNLNRWYDPANGKWISEDPIGFAGDPSNLYRYVGNVPNGRIDPNGLQAVQGSASYTRRPSVNATNGLDFEITFTYSGQKLTDSSYRAVNGIFFQNVDIQVIGKDKNGRIVGRKRQMTIDMAPLPTADEARGTLAGDIKNFNMNTTGEPVCTVEEVHRRSFEFVGDITWLARSGGNVVQQRWDPNNREHEGAVFNRVEYDVIGMDKLVATAGTLKDAWLFQRTNQAIHGIVSVKAFYDLRTRKASWSISATVNNGRYDVSQLTSTGNVSF
jgi:RHS repeat-associated protein